MRCSSRSTAFCSLALLPLVLASPVLGDEEPSEGWAAATAADGARLFRASCAGCHGVRGDGKSDVALALSPPPRNLTRGEYRFRTTASGTLALREDLLRTLERGLVGTAMPSWKEQLDGRALRSLVLFLETLSPRFTEELRLSEDVLTIAAPEPWAPAPETLTQGKALYEKMKCGQCHGKDGRGDGTAADTHKNSDGSPSHVFDFTTGLYKGGAAPSDVYRTFMTGLDGSPMPSYAPSLPDEAERWALVAYCLSLSRARGLWFYLSERPTWTDPATR